MRDLSPRKMIGSENEGRCQLTSQGFVWMGRAHTVCDYYRILPCDRLVGDSLGQVDGQEDRVSLSSFMIEGCFEEDCKEKEISTSLLQGCF